MTGARTAVVWCPDWPVVATGVADDVPAAVLSGDGGRGEVLACSAAARTAGVRRGMGLRQAQHRCPEMRVLAHDPAGELRAFETVLEAVEAFVPWVEIVRPGLCAFPARGPARYFGGEGNLADRVAAAVEEALGRRCGVGVADGPFTGRLAARRGEVVPSDETAGFLSPWPVGVLDRPELADLLFRLGIRTLGEFAALPDGDVLARFGPDGAAAHRLAGGLAARPAVPRRPPLDLTVQTELDPPTIRVDTASFAAKTLADTLHARLVAHGLVCTQLAVEVDTVDGERLTRLWRHDGLTATAVADRVRWQLEGWLTGDGPASGDADDSGATDALSVLRLAAREVTEAGSHQLGLWGDAADAEKAVRALDRVQGLLGADGVVVPVLVGGRDPAARVRWVPWGEPAGPGPDPNHPWPGRLPTPSPAVVHPVPLPAEVSCASGEPVTVSGRGIPSAAPARLAVDGDAPAPVSAWAGPWVADERWWDPTRCRRRARFQLVTTDGTAHLAAVEGGRWWVEGTYD